MRASGVPTSFNRIAVPGTSTPPAGPLSPRNAPTSPHGLNLNLAKPGSPSVGRPGPSTLSVGDGPLSPRSLGDGAQSPSGPRLGPGNARPLTPAGVATDGPPADPRQFYAGFQYGSGRARPDGRMPPPPPAVTKASNVGIKKPEGFSPEEVASPSRMMHNRSPAGGPGERRPFPSPSPEDTSRGFPVSPPPPSYSGASSLPGSIENRSSGSHSSADAPSGGSLQALNRSFGANLGAAVPNLPLRIPSPGHPQSSGSGALSPRGGAPPPRPASQTGAADPRVFGSSTPDSPRHAPPIASRPQASPPAKSQSSPQHPPRSPPSMSSSSSPKAPPPMRGPAAAKAGAAESGMPPRAKSFGPDDHLRLSHGSLHAACPKCGTFVDKEDCKPLMLKCGHSFCTACCTSMVARDSIECPSCRKPTPLAGQGVAALSVNYAFSTFAQMPMKELQSNRRNTVTLLDDIGATCPICLEAYRQDFIPCMLSCGHTMCQKCTANKPETCPECNAKLEDTAVNKPLQKALEALIAWKRQINGEEK